MAFSTRNRSLKLHLSCDMADSCVLLAKAACLEAVELPPAAIEMVQICGRLPLTLGICGRMIREFGEGWEDVLPDHLRSEGFLGEEDSEGGMTVQTRIIMKSIKSIAIPDGDEIGLLFSSLAVFAEDEKIQIAVVSALHSSYQDKKTAQKVPLTKHRMRVRKWVHVLLDKSLLLGSVGAGIALHGG
jgi:hypothetical protein